MPFQIRHDGKVYRVHTEVGNGLTRVIFVQENDPAQADVQRTNQPAGERRDTEASTA